MRSKTTVSRRRFRKTSSAVAAAVTQLGRVHAHSIPPMEIAIRTRNRMFAFGSISITDSRRCGAPHSLSHEFASIRQPPTGISFWTSTRAQTTSGSWVVDPAMVSNTVRHRGRVWRRRCLAGAIAKRRFRWRASTDSVCRISVDRHR